VSSILASKQGHTGFSVEDAEQSLNWADKVYGQRSSFGRSYSSVLSNNMTLLSLTSSRAFEVVVTVLILGNVVVIGMQADHAIKSVENDDVWVGFLIADVFFLFAFLLELLLRLVAEGSTQFFVTSKLRWWNMFDTVLVIMSMLEEIGKITWATMPDISSLRIARIVRLIKVVRVIRMARFFHDLRIMVYGIALSLKSLVWAMMLLLIIGFMFGVCILEVVSIQLVSMRSSWGTEELARLKLDLFRFWGSMSSTLYTLYMVMCGGIDWGDVAAPLIEVTPGLGLLMCLYVAIAVFCVLNIVTGVFVKNTENMFSRDETHLVMQTIESRKQWIEEVKQLWGTFQTRELDFESFSDKVKDVRTQALFHKLGLEVEWESVAGLFELLDFDGTGTVNLDEFAIGIQMLHGQAKNIDMARLRHQVSLLSKNLAEIMDLLRQQQRCPSPSTRPGTAS